MQMRRGALVGTLVVAVLGVPVAARGLPAFSTTIPGSRPTSSRTPPARDEMQQLYAKAPLAFEENRGQTDRRVDFLARSAGQSLFLSSNQAVISGAESGQNAGASVGMRLVGAALGAAATPADPQDATVNYIGSGDSTSVGTYGRVNYSSVYPGVDLTYYGNRSQLEYDFTIAPGADPRAIALAFDGSSGVKVNPKGDLVVSTPKGNLVQHKPVSYQDVGGVRRAVSSHFVVDPFGAVHFQVGAFDHTRPLVIDPILVFSTYFGGSGDDSITGITTDRQGFVYVVGTTGSRNFPTTPGAVQPTPQFAGSRTAFVAKFYPQLVRPAYSTFLSSTGTDEGIAIAVDASGSAYVLGRTFSTNFPTTPGAFAASGPRAFNTFIAKLTPDGSTLQYSTLFPGNVSGVQISAKAIALDGAGNAYVTGGVALPDTVSTDFPTTPGAYRTACSPRGSGCSEGFLAKFNPGGNGAGDLLYSTYLGGFTSQGTRLTVDQSGVAYIVGIVRGPGFPTSPGAFSTTVPAGSNDINYFIVKLNPVGAGGADLLYSTYLGGSKDDGGFGGDITLGSDGTVYVAGDTSSPDFPTTPGAYQRQLGGRYDAFLARFDLAGGGNADLLYSTYLGGRGTDSGRGVRVDSSGHAWIAGFTAVNSFDANQTNDFPIVNPLACCPKFISGSDVFIAEIDPVGGGKSDLIVSVILGGTGSEEPAGIALFDQKPSLVYVAGRTNSRDYPVSAAPFQPTYGGGNFDGFISGIAPVRSDVPAPSSTTTTSTPSSTTTTTLPSSTTTTTIPSSTTTTTMPSSNSCTQFVQAQQAAFNDSINQQEQGQSPSVVASLEQTRAQGNASFQQALASCRG